MISSKRLGGRKGIQSVKAAWSALHSQLKSCILPPLERNYKERKTNTITDKFTDWIFLKSHPYLN